MPATSSVFPCFLEPRNGSRTMEEKVVLFLVIELILAIYF